MSYVRNAGDIVKVRGLIESICGEGPQPEIIAKIETEDAIEDIHNILKETDGIIGEENNFRITSGVNVGYRF